MWRQEKRNIDAGLAVVIRAALATTAVPVVAVVTVVAADIVAAIQVIAVTRLSIPVTAVITVVAPVTAVTVLQIIPIQVIHPMVRQGSIILITIREIITIPVKVLLITNSQFQTIPLLVSRQNNMVHKITLIRDTPPKNIQS